MLFLIFIIYFLFLGIIYYIYNKKDCELSFYFLYLIGIMGIVELSIYLYYSIKGESVCDITKKLVC